MKWLLLSGTRDPFIYEAGWCLRVMFPECQAAPPPTHTPLPPYVVQLNELILRGQRRTRAETCRLSCRGIKRSSARVKFKWPSATRSVLKLRRFLFRTRPALFPFSSEIRDLNRQRRERHRNYRGSCTVDEPGFI